LQIGDRGRNSRPLGCRVKLAARSRRGSTELEPQRQNKRQKWVERVFKVRRLAMRVSVINLGKPIQIYMDSLTIVYL
jgi:hypothetical protein